MLHILSVIGTRPEAIKMAPVVRELDRHPDDVRSTVCVTGQHRQMLDQVLRLFNIQPDYDLNLMKPDQSLADLTASLLTDLGRLVQEERPDWILAQGDTTTVLTASLIAFYSGIRFGHVEAGLRTNDLRQPFPEEMNRRVADQLAALLFAPTSRSRDNLLAEGHAAETILVTGNTGIDALLSVAEMPFDWTSGPLPDLEPGQPMVLITAHRRESFGAPFREMCLALRDLAQSFALTRFVYPVHLNPNVQQPVMEILGDLPNMTLTSPVDYLTLVNLIKHSSVVLTDSGGIQEEAPTFGVPVLVMRSTTERPEGVEANMAKLVGTERASIVKETSRLLSSSPGWSEASRRTNPYGDGKAAERIVARLIGGPNPS